MKRARPAMITPKVMATSLSLISCLHVVALGLDPPREGRGDHRGRAGGSHRLDGSRVRLLALNVIGGQVLKRSGERAPQRAVDGRALEPGRLPRVALILRRPRLAVCV